MTNPNSRELCFYKTISPVCYQHPVPTANTPDVWSHLRNWEVRLGRCVTGMGDRASPRILLAEGQSRLPRVVFPAHFTPSASLAHPHANTADWRLLSLMSFLSLRSYDPPHTISWVVGKADFSALLFLNGGEFQDEHGASPRIIPQYNVAAVLLHHIVHHRQPETGALTLTRSEKRVEYS